MTFGEMLDRAAACRTEDEALCLAQAAIDEATKADPELSLEDARRIVLQNIGYGAGYYDRETADRIFRLFHTEHPIFGLCHPTPDEAFRAGIERAQRAG